MNLKRVLSTVGCSMLLASAAMLPRASRADDLTAATPAAPTTGPTTRPGMTLITLHLKQTTGEDAFAALSKQSGVKFSGNGDIWQQDSTQKPVDIDIVDKPFWSVAMELCNDWDLAMQNNFQQNNGVAPRIQLIPRSQMGQGGKNPLPTAEANGFLVQAVSFQRNQSLDYSAPDRSQNNCSIQMRVYIDPALQVQSFNQQGHVTEATDELGHSMTFPNNGNMYFGGGGGQRSIMYDCNVPLKYPDGAGKKISSLKCFFTVRASDSLDRMSVDKPLEASEVEKTAGALTVTLHSVTKQGDGNQYQAKVSIARDDDGGGNGGNDLWMMLQNAKLMDSKGRTFGFGGGGGGGNNNGAYEYTISYYGQNGESPVGPPVKWQFDIPLKTHSIRIPVEFKDLPMP